MIIRSKRHIQQQFSLPPIGRTGQNSIQLDGGGRYNLNTCISSRLLHIPWTNIRRSGFEVREILSSYPNELDSGGFLLYEAEFPKRSFDIFGIRHTYVIWGIDLLSNAEFDSGDYLGFSALSRNLNHDITSECRSGIVVSSPEVGWEFHPTVFAESETVSDPADYYGIRFYVSEKFVNAHDMSDLMFYSSIGVNI